MTTFDVQEAWGELLAALHNREWRMVKELAAALRTHVKGGGTLPRIFAEDVELPEEFVRGCVLFDCELALQLAEANLS
ncbi:hypothetical protein A2454_01425 [Candidatus Peribacteria bacterium RIFOXYC2_FULL_55_14]|nr:MAG: hypothetical protein UY87_C0003G0006 [Candidatus Peribacteria bacterium GW2011_GWC2_54_8]KKW44292.1 MAG: hypothetical protein UY90_C0014G0009 [Candidatus Peregrinibacteria bacterium GW2011_GWA2_54_9]OGJ72839.1 MAG: hypothetical protein A2198_00540 [Candidatus Peribacteria bacterium RIFOXYA1_FULL_56_14]OGJ73386.1 MAG: hypothetical protein A2217_01605 [Candidatus Peribacteria bacterium RIFOXYA2_FULL_55_28]OGJ74568.1 MAG: hypothetical protein A2384_02895 [Candidatus Peribacteria bacterium 